MCRAQPRRYTDRIPQMWKLRCLIRQNRNRNHRALNWPTWKQPADCRESSPFSTCHADHVHRRRALYEAVEFPVMPTRALYSFLRNPWGQMYFFKQPGEKFPLWSSLDIRIANKEWWTCRKKLITLTQENYICAYYITYSEGLSTEQCHL